MADDRTPFPERPPDVTTRPPTKPSLAARSGTVEPQRSGPPWAVILLGALVVAGLGVGVYRIATAKRKSSKPTVELSIETRPPGASATLDGRLLGKTPVRTNVPSDTADHDLRLTLDGHVPSDQHLTLNKAQGLSIELLPTP